MIGIMAITPTKRLSNHRKSPCSLWEIFAQNAVKPQWLMRRVAVNVTPVVIVNVRLLTAAQIVWQRLIFNIHL
jgi:hypothetical protein